MEELPDILSNLLLRQHAPFRVGQWFRAMTPCTPLAPCRRYILSGSFVPLHRQRGLGEQS